MCMDCDSYVLDFLVVSDCMFGMILINIFLILWFVLRIVEYESVNILLYFVWYKKIYVF